MRRLAAFALVAACGGNDAPDASAVSLVLDIPNGMLDPQGYTSVDLVMHERAGDVTRTASITQGGSFGVNNQAKSGETLEYRVSYTNNGK